jgi:hypothetical protein
MNTTKKITKATAKSLVRKHAAELGSRVKIDSDLITFWFAGEGLDVLDGEESATAAAEAIARELGGLSIHSNGSKSWIHYKAEPAPKGDWNDRSSAWHY